VGRDRIVQFNGVAIVHTLHINRLILIYTHLYTFISIFFSAFYIYIVFLLFMQFSHLCTNYNNNTYYVNANLN